VLYKRLKKGPKSANDVPQGPSPTPASMTLIDRSSGTAAMANQESPRKRRGQQDPGAPTTAPAKGYKSRRGRRRDVADPLPRKGRLYRTTSAEAHKAGEPGRRPIRARARGEIEESVSVSSGGCSVPEVSPRLEAVARDLLH